MKRAVIGVGLALLCVRGAAAQAPAQSPLEGAAFMAGCWRGPAGGERVIEEFYLQPTRNLMQGMTRYVGPRPNVAGRFTVDYEFTLLDVDGTKIRLRPHPKGQPSVVFTEIERAPGRLVWENPTHDFPQRISYTAVAGDSLLARIEGKTPQGERAMEWKMGRIVCPVGP